MDAREMPSSGTNSDEDVNRHPVQRRERDLVKVNSPSLPATLRIVVVLVWLGLAVSCGPATRVVTIGVLNFSPSTEMVFQGFKYGMSTMGFPESQKVRYAYSGGAAPAGSLDQVVSSLKTQKVDLILAITTPAALAAQKATESSRIPVVFAPVNDPVAAGLVKTLSQPGGNLTGIRTGGFVAKELEWLNTLAPSARRVLVPHNPNEPSSVAALESLQKAAKQLGIDLVVSEATTPAQLEALFADFPEDVDAILLGPNNLAVAHITDFVRISKERRLPLASVSYDQAEAGALLSFGPDFYVTGQQAAWLAERVLNGVPPANLPVESADLFLGINLNTAASIGLHIPEQLLQHADHIIR